MSEVRPRRTASLRPRPRLHLGRALAPALGACLVAYFVHHAAYGERGLEAKRQLEAEVAAARAELGLLREARVRLERRTRALTAAGLDRDLLDERARFALGYAAPGETVLLLTQAGGLRP